MARQPTSIGSIAHPGTDGSERLGSISVIAIQDKTDRPDPHPDERQQGGTQPVAQAWR